MSNYFPDVPPDPKLSIEEKRRIARRFRRRANLTDGCPLLSVALSLLGMVLHDNVPAANFLFGICLLPLLAFAIGSLHLLPLPRLRKPRGPRGVRAISGPLHLAGLRVPCVLLLPGLEQVTPFKYVIPRVI